MIHHMFVFGVVIPTLITILVFVGFLICWFKFNIHDRLFKKKFLSKPMKKLPPHLPVNGPHKIVHFSAGNDDKDDQGDDGDDEDDGNDDNGASTVSTEGKTPSSKNLHNLDEEGSVGEDVETALCISENCQNEEIEGFSNPNMCMCSSPSEIRTEVTKVDSLVQHTFHFPISDCTQLSGLAVDSEADSEDGNYGHFVPLSQALKDPKTRQLFEAAGLGTTGSAQLKEITSASPASSPIKHAKCDHIIKSHLTPQTDSNGHMIAV